MKKNMKLALIIGVISIIIIVVVGLVGSITPVNNQPQTSEKEIPVQSVPEGKSFVLKLDDSVSTTSP